MRLIERLLHITLRTCVKTYSLEWKTLITPEETLHGTSILIRACGLQKDEILKPAALNNNKVPYRYTVWLSIVICQHFKNKQKKAYPHFFHLKQYVHNMVDFTTALKLRRIQFVNVPLVSHRECKTDLCISCMIILGIK